MRELRREGLLAGKRLTKHSVESRPHKSQWQKFCCRGTDKSFMNVTGLTRLNFHKLVRYLFGTSVSGRKTTLNYAGKLGLFLVYVGTDITMNRLCDFFNTSLSTAQSTINEIMEVITTKLAKNDAARLRFPSKDEMEGFAEAVRHRHPCVKNVIGFVERLTVSVLTEGDDAEESYSSQYLNTVCHNTLVFAPSGKIVCAVLNRPGGWNAAQACAPISAVAETRLGDYAFCVDQKYPRDVFNDNLVGPMTQSMIDELSPILKDAYLRQDAVYSTLRKAAQPGLSVLTATYPRLKCRLGGDKHRRGKLIYSMVLLYNYITDKRDATVFDHTGVELYELADSDRVIKQFRG